ncbi:MAG: CBS domain-containing protein [Bdellovibrionales bacterium]
MSIEALCQSDPICILKQTSLRQAATLMRRHNVGGLVVTSNQNSRQPLAVVTDRDLAIATLADNLSPDFSVEKIMSPEIVTIEASAGIAEAADLMNDKGVRRLVVMNEAGEVCGLVTADDILQLLARELYSIGHLVEKQSAKLRMRGGASASSSGRAIQL